MRRRRRRILRWPPRRGGDETGLSQGLGRGDRSRAGFGAQDKGRLQVRGGVGGLRELLTELAEGRMRGPLTDEAEGRDVPEHGGPAVAEHHFIALGQAEQIGQSGADAADEVLHRRLAVAGAEHLGRGRGQRLDLGRTDAGRAGPEASVGGQKVVRDLNIRRSHARYSTAGPLGVRDRSVM